MEQSQTRRLVTALLASIAVFYLYLLVANHVLPPSQKEEIDGQASPTPGEVATTQPTGGDPATTRPDVAEPDVATTRTVQAVTGQALVSASEVVEMHPLGDATPESPYPMRLEFDQKGAVVTRAEIRGHYDTLSRKDPYPIIEPVPARGGLTQDRLRCVLPLAAAQDIGKNGLPTRLREGLASAGIQVSNRAQVVSVHDRQEWVLCDGNTYYGLAVVSGSLYVYDVPLAPSFATGLRLESLQLDVPLAEAIWSVSDRTDERVVFTTEVFSPADQRPLVRVDKIYELLGQPVEARTFDLGLALKITNLTDQQISVILTQQGAVGFRKEDYRTEGRRVVRAVWKPGKSEVEIDKYERKSVTPRKLKDLGGDTTGGDLLAWVATGNKYFGCIMTAAGRFSASDEARFARAEAIHLNDIEDSGATQLARQDFTFRFVTLPIGIEAGASKEVAFDCYLGPESRESFLQVEAYQKRDYYAVIAANFYCCAPAWLVGFMVGLLDLFHAIPPHNYGIAIILLVIVVRAALHPVTRRSQMNMQKMQKQQAKLKPKLDAIKAKFGNDRAKIHQATMELYKEEGINPAGQVLNCLPMMLQIPIWGALWMGLNYTIEMRHQPFDGWWIRDLTQPDAVIEFSRAYMIPLLSSLMGGGVESLNILPILLGITQVLQTRFMPRSSGAAQPPGGAPDQLGQQRKMMMFASVFFVFILYNAPSGLNLYIMVSNVVGMLEQWQIRKRLRVLEERGELHAPRKASRGTKNWFQRKWEDLQKQAEQARKIQSDRPRRQGKR